MKKVIVSLLILMFAFVPFSCSSTSDAIDYNNKMVEEQKKIIDEIQELTEVIVALSVEVTEEEKTELEAKHKECIATIEEVKQTIKNMGDFDGDSTLLNGFLDIINFYEKVFKNEYSEIIEIYTSNEITTEDLDRIDTLVDNIIEEEEKYDANLYNAQEKFAEKYDFILE